MRTTLNLDADALQRAMALTPGSTKTDVINLALHEYARRRRLRDLLKFEGKMAWEGDLDALRKRRPSKR